MYFCQKSFYFSFQINWFPRLSVSVSGKYKCSSGGEREAGVTIVSTERELQHLQFKIEYTNEWCPKN